MQATTRADASDSGMTYFLLTGDEQGTPVKFQTLLEKRQIPPVLDPRPVIRLEAENFRTLQDCTVHYGDRKASQRLHVQREGAGALMLETRFHEPYAADGMYRLAVCCQDQAQGQATYTLYLNGHQQGKPWTTQLDDARWRNHEVNGIPLKRGDRITIKIESREGHRGSIDYLELRLS
ncbi:hypothetical protein ACFL6U_29495 [Planctomycetota bacterium]